MADQAKADGIAWLRALLAGPRAKEVLIGRRGTVREAAEEAAAPASAAPAAPRG